MTMKFKNLLKIVIFVILFNGIISSFISIAIVPDKYDKNTYTKEEVRDIARKEKNSGVSLGYKIYGENQFYSSISLLLLFITYLSLSKKEDKNRA